jgi:hypothetical protein
MYDGTRLVGAASAYGAHAYARPPVVTEQHAFSDRTALVLQRWLP